MTLIQLRYAKEIELKTATLAELETRSIGFKTREEELELALREAMTDEDMSLVGSEIEKLEEDRKNLTDEIDRVREELTMVEVKLADLHGNNGDDAKGREKDRILGNRERSTENNLQTRGANTMKNEMATNYYQERSVINFYEDLKNINTRSVTGEGLTVPQIVLDRIMIQVGDYTTLYPLVDKIQVGGTARILLDVAEEGATWLEMTAAIPESSTGEIRNVDFDGFKLGKITAIDNSFLKDSIVNLDAYVTKKIALAISKSLDKAILLGTGASTKQPDGIIPKLKVDNKVAVTLLNDARDIARVVAPIGLIDDGESSTGEIVAVMKRKTYYNRIVAMNMGNASDGIPNAKLPNLSKPTMLGLPVVFNSNMKEDDILYGEFDKYTLVEREDITIERSEHAKFSQDQLAIRGKGRFDGKPTNVDSFVLVTMS